jgi:hypothetical protein
VIGPDPGPLSWYGQLAVILASLMGAGVGLTPDPPTTATRVTTVCVADEATCYPPTTPPRSPWAWCEEWHELAASVGWPESDGPVLSYVIRRESNCQPGAYNRSGATGLMQIIGGCAPYGSCFDPAANLARGLDMWRTRGWQPWCLRGDPVTGSC